MWTLKRINLAFKGLNSFNDGLWLSAKPLEKYYVPKFRGTLIRNVSPFSTFPSSVPRKWTLIRPGTVSWFSTVSRSYQRSDLDINTNTISYSHSRHWDKVDVTLNSKQVPFLFWSPATLPYLCNPKYSWPIVIGICMNMTNHLEKNICQFNYIRIWMS